MNLKKIKFLVLVTTTIFFISACATVREINPIYKYDENGEKIVFTRAGRPAECLEIRAHNPEGPNIAVVNCYYTDNGENILTASGAGPSLLQSIFSNSAAGAAIGGGIGAAGSGTSTSSTVSKTAGERGMIDSPGGAIR